MSCLAEYIEDGISESNQGGQGFQKTVFKDFQVPFLPFLKEFSRTEILFFKEFSRIQGPMASLKHGWLVGWCGGNSCQTAARRISILHSRTVGFNILTEITLGFTARRRPRTAQAPAAMDIDNKEIVITHTCYFTTTQSPTPSNAFTSAGDVISGNEYSTNCHFLLSTEFHSN